jgi:endonuclease III
MRLGLLPFTVDVKAAHDFLQELVPSRIRRTLHINLVHHGRATCFPGVPRCEVCVLRNRCPTGRARSTNPNSEAAPGNGRYWHYPAK